MVNTLSRAAIAAAAILLFGAAQAQVEQDFMEALEDESVHADDEERSANTPPAENDRVTFGDLIRSGLAAGASPRVTISIFGHPGACPLCGFGGPGAEAYKDASAP